MTDPAQPRSRRSSNAWAYWSIGFFVAGVASPFIVWRVIDPKQYDGAGQMFMAVIAVVVAAASAVVLWIVALVHAIVAVRISRGSKGVSDGTTGPNRE